ncbi:Retrovirus-related Pol polyprotein from transposon TNT 1-94 [Bienertia sinuspersici]
MNRPLSEVIQHMKKWMLDNRKEMTGQYKEEKAMAVQGGLDVPTTVKKTKIDMATLWHQRLGHAPLDRIKQIKGLIKDILRDEEDYLICPVAKLAKLPFKPSTSRAKEPFELIDFDTWGPYKVGTRQGNKYFLTIVDDHSRTIWINLMKEKGEAYEARVNFFNMARNQYNRTMKRIRSDNAPEFSDKQCKPLFDALGVIHETSCNYRPQQNGRVERRRRNLREMAMALRFQSGLAISFWGERIQAAVFITNRLPTTILKNCSPYEVLHSIKPK